ncbi:PTS fructose transporter subunit IIA [uncultured Parolsenella sp.]|uniref:PTS sugar transporter subunit IIA n=1 Tax=uncultured Parolsenella sp. TaxID=2083008 RepID=UPI0027DDD337|nr:PTS fructose transporter subunit IIA [uncultured Parolsenella sp.]
MIGFLLTGHGEFAPGLASALELVAGKQEAFKVVPFDVEKAAEYPELLHTEIEQLREETDAVLVFVDLLGGTPFNQAMINTQSISDVNVVTGTNLPMLIETLFTRNSDASATLDSLTECALAAGQNGVVTRKLGAVASDEDDE